ERRERRLARSFAQTLRCVASEPVRSTELGLGSFGDLAIRAAARRDARRGSAEAGDPLRHLADHQLRRLRLAVTWAEDLGHLRLRVERVNVRRVMALEASLGAWLRDRDLHLVRLRRVERSRAVTDLALHVLEIGDVGHRAPSGLVEAGDVAADAVEVRLLELV